MTTKAEQRQKILAQMNRNPYHETLHDQDDVLVVRFTHHFPESHPDAGKVRSVSWESSTTWGGSALEHRDIGTQSEHLSWSSSSKNEDVTIAEQAASLMYIFADAYRRAVWL